MTQNTLYMITVNHFFPFLWRHIRMFAICTQVLPRLGVVDLAHQLVLWIWWVSLETYKTRTLAQENTGEF